MTHRHNLDVWHGGVIGEAGEHIAFSTRVLYFLCARDLSDVCTEYASVDTRRRRTNCEESSKDTLLPYSQVSTVSVALYILGPLRAHEHMVSEYYCGMCAKSSL